MPNARQALIDRAEAAIGPHDPDDDVLNLDECLKSLKDDAAPLREILMRDNIQAIAKRYKGLNKDASEAQKSEKWAALWSNSLPFVVLILCGILFVAVILALVARQSGNPIGVWMWITLFVLFATAFFYVLVRKRGRLAAHDDPPSLWMSTRFAAEKLRRDIFEAVFAEKQMISPATGAPTTLMLQLEFFRRYQLELQIAYYTKKIAADQKSLIGTYGKLSRFRLIAEVLLLCLLLLLGLFVYAMRVEQGVLSYWPPVVSHLLVWLSDWAARKPEEILVAAMALVLLATIAFGQGLVGATASNRTKLRVRIFKPTLESLKRLQAFGLPLAREAAFDNRKEDVIRFMETVHQIMVSEQQLFFGELAQTADAFTPRELSPQEPAAATPSLKSATSG